MIDFFQCDTDEYRRDLLIRARKVALSSLVLYDLDWVSIQFIQLSDTITYKIETSTEGTLLLRIHSDRWSKEEIRSELTFLHFRSQMNKLEACRVSFLSDKGWRLYQAAAEKCVFQIAGMNQNDDNYGLIHADLHIGNFVFNNDQPYAIDFGRCGYGYFLYDMAATVLGLNPKHRRIYIQGYSSVRKMETDYISDLECFFIMSMIQNYCHHASDSRETSQLISEQPYAQAYISNFLNNTSLLFEEIIPVNIE